MSQNAQRRLVTAQSLVWQPGGTPGGNIYTSWAALYAALELLEGPVVIHVDDTLGSPVVMPAGTYNLDNVTLSGQANGADAIGGAILQLADGVVLQGASAAASWTLKVESTLELVYTGTHTCITVTTGEFNLYLSQGVSLRCSAAGTFCALTGAGYVQVYAVNEVQIESLAAGGPVFSCAAGELEIQNLGGATIGDGVHNAIVQTGGTCNVFARVNCSVAAQACTGTVALSYDYPSKTPGAQGAGVVVTQLLANPFMFAAFASLTTAVAQSIPPGSGALTSSADVVLGAIASKPGTITNLSVAFTGAAGNVGGQTATVQLYKNGVAVTAATTAALATTAGVKTANVAFAAVSYVAGDVLTMILTPSGVLTTALADVMASVS